jgi:hypothetical protein
VTLLSGEATLSSTGGSPYPPNKKKVWGREKRWQEMPEIREFLEYFVI